MQISIYVRDRISHQNDAKIEEIYILRGTCKTVSLFNGKHKIIRRIMYPKNQSIIINRECKHFTLFNSIYGGLIMRSKRIPAERQYYLIMECRQNGLVNH